MLVELHDIFARHGSDIGINEEFKVKLTPKDDSPAYSQSLLAPINLKKDILVEVAMLHKNEIITTLPFSKYAGTIFAQTKPNGKLRLLVDLRNQQPSFGRFYKQYSPCQYPSRWCATYSRQNNCFANWTVRRHIIA